MEKFKTLKGENRLLILGIPVLVIIAVAGWAIWRSTATLDDIEARTLAPASVMSLTWEHLLIVVVSAVFVLITAIPLGIVLTRPATQFLSPVVTGIANIGQAAPVIGVISYDTVNDYIRSLNAAAAHDAADDSSPKEVDSGGEI